MVGHDTAYTKASSTGPAVPLTHTRSLFHHFLSLLHPLRTGRDPYAHSMWGDRKVNGTGQKWTRLQLSAIAIQTPEMRHILLLCLFFLSFVLCDQTAWSYVVTSCPDCLVSSWRACPTDASLRFRSCRCLAAFSLSAFYRYRRTQRRRTVRTILILFMTMVSQSVVHLSEGTDLSRESSGASMDEEDLELIGRLVHRYCKSSQGRLHLSTQLIDSMYVRKPSARRKNNCH